MFRVIGSAETLHVRVLLKLTFSLAKPSFQTTKRPPTSGFHRNSGLKPLSLLFHAQTTEGRSYGTNTTLSTGFLLGVRKPLNQASCSLSPDWRRSSGRIHPLCQISGSLHFHHALQQ